MIDGIKLKCIGTDPADWERNPLLKFATKIDTITGEFLAKNKVAFYRGLAFHLVPSTVSNTTHCIIKGSLATFYNQGINNAFDFDIMMLQETISELKNIFSVNPTKAEIQAFEYGANIIPQQTTKQIINGLRAYQLDNFTGLKMDNVFNGKQLQRQEYIFKIYDKGLQVSKPHSNMLRIEYAIKSKKNARRYGINVLADLTNTNKLNRLKNRLLEVWEDVIFYDKGMRWRNMTHQQREKMLYYLDATNWGTFTKMQRNRAKKQFRDLYARFCTSTTQPDILELLRLKLDDLTAVECYPLRNFLNENDSSKKELKMLPFTHLDKDVKSNTKTKQKTSTKQQIKKLEKLQKNESKKCCVCGSKISHKKSSAVYCSKRCNNSNHAKKRKMKRHEIKKLETESLNNLLNNLNKRKLKLLIEYRADGVEYADRLKQKEIHAPPEWIRAVFRVKIYTYPNEIILTSYRARKLIKSINILNT